MGWDQSAVETKLSAAATAALRCVRQLRRFFPEVHVLRPTAQNTLFFAPVERSAAPDSFLRDAASRVRLPGVDLVALLDALWDERWFIRCTDPAAQRQRLIYRHLETWNEEKTQRWGPGEEGAAARADANDVLNMELIAPCEAFADRVIISE